MIAALLLAAAQVTPAPAPAPVATPTPAPAPAPAPAPLPATRVTLTTAAGPITIALETQKAPITAANFLKYVAGKRLDGTVFYRAVKVAPGYGFVQFGAQNEPKRVLPPIKHEPTTQTGLSHVDGAISMAMNTPGTASGDFFIIVGDTPGMDAKGDAPGYAVFGRVVEGMDVVRAILDMPKSRTKGAGIMKGQMLEPTVKVVTARKVAG